MPHTSRWKASGSSSESRNSTHVVAARKVGKLLRYALARNELLHDGSEFTRNNSILAHFGDANPVINNYIALSTTQQNQIVTFLNSL